MKELPGILWAIYMLIFAFVHPSHAAEQPLPPALRAALQQTHIPATALFAQIQRIEGDIPQLRWQTERAVSPASTIKLLTTLAGLELLGPTYQWQTTLYGVGKPVGDTWHGPLYLHGQGDPKLTLDSLSALFAQLLERGIRRIDGVLHLDRSIYPTEFTLPTPLDENLHAPYNVIPDPLMVQFNTVRVRLFGDAGQIRVAVTPAVAGLIIDNQLIPGEGNCTNWREKLHIQRQAVDEGITLVLKGFFPANCLSAEYYTAIGPHPIHTASSVHDIWNNRGGEWPLLSGQLATRTDFNAIVPTNATILAVQPSLPLADLIRDINKYSNNPMARQLFITIGLQAAPNASPQQSAMRAIEQWLGQKGLYFPELILENGSGLSRIEKISTAHLTQLLMAGWHSPYMPEYLATFPIAGLDGTVKKRFQNTAGTVRIKTGSLKHVRAIAGYVKSQSGQWVIVIGILNHPRAEHGAAVLDALVHMAISQ